MSGLHQYLHSSRKGRRSRALYSSPDDSLRVVCLVSKAYAKGKADYWFGFHPHQRDTLAEANTGYAAFGCGSSVLTVLIPFEKFLPLLDGMNTTNRDGRQYWHVQIFEEGGELILLRKKGQAQVSYQVGSGLAISHSFGKLPRVTW